jgi:hypothetical protein
MKTLPAAVVACLDSEFRLSPHWREAVEVRLLGLPEELWQLKVDWTQWAVTIDRLARVSVRKRSPNTEARAHLKIANGMRKVANGLKADGETDTRLDGVLHWAPKFGYAGMPIVPIRDTLKPERARLSDFLRLAADIYEGARLRIIGVELPEIPRRKGKRGAAIAAADQLTTFMKEHTGQPHVEMVGKIVSIYHPDPKDRGFGRTLRARTGKTKKK